MNDRARAVLQFWFDERGGDVAALRERWFRKDAAFDDEIRRTFGDDIDRAARGDLDAWADEAAGALALVVLLDQMPRNVFRGSPRAFAGDARALSVSRGAQARGLDRALSFMERSNGSLYWSSWRSAWSRTTARARRPAGVIS